MLSQSLSWSPSVKQSSRQFFLVLCQQKIILLCKDKALGNFSRAVLGPIFASIVSLHTKCISVSRTLGNFSKAVLGPILAITIAITKHNGQNLRQFFGAVLGSILIKRVSPRWKRKPQSTRNQARVRNGTRLLRIGCGALHVFCLEVHVVRSAFLRSYI